MKFKILGFVLSSLFLFGCANTSNQTKDNIIKEKVAKVEDKIFYTITTVQEFPIEGSEGSIEKMTKEISIYNGHINLNSDGIFLNDKTKEILSKKISTPYIASKMFDEKGNKEELRTEAITGLAFNVLLDKEDKYLIFKLKEIADWKKVNTKNSYGVDEYIVIPGFIEVEEMILIPLRSFEMSRFFDSSKGRIIVKIKLTNKESL